MLFKLKLALSELKIGDFFVRKKLTQIDRRISSRIVDFEYDCNAVNKHRKQNRAEVIKLQRAMKRSDARNVSGMRRKSLKDVRAYETSARKQLTDLMQIITQLKKLIENEYLEIMYDIRTPLVTFEDFFTELRRALFGIKLSPLTSRSMSKTIRGMETAYDELIKYVLDFIENDFKYYKSIGLDMNKLELVSETDYAFETHLKTRAKLKQQINGKTQWIIGQIQQLEKKIAKLEDKIGTDFKDNILHILAYFRRQFEELVGFGFKRVDAANHMIVESLVLQKEKYEEMEALRRDLSSFYDAFLREQDVMAKKNAGSRDAINATKRREQFKNYRDSIADEIRRFMRQFDKRIVKVEKRELEAVQDELEEAKQVKVRVVSYGTKWKRYVAAGLLAIGLTGFAMAPRSSGVGVVRDSAVHSLTGARQSGGIATALLRGDIKSIQTIINNLTKKVRKGGKLTDKERDFVKSVYVLLASGGLAKGIPTASVLMNYYISAKGATKANPFQLKSGVYENCPGVQEAMEKMQAYLIKQHDKGKIKDKGQVNSTRLKRVLKGRSRDQDMSKSGIMRNGGVKAGRDDSKDLFFSDRRFDLVANYAFKEDGTLSIRWSVLSIYDFEKGTGKRTPIPVPGRNVTLYIPHDLSKAAHDQGIAREFWHIARWKTTVSIPAGPLLAQK